LTQKIKYTPEPIDKVSYTQEFDRAYTRFANPYDWIVKFLPIWKGWIGKALPHIRGPRVLEVSFGTGYLLTRYANRYDTFGIDLNARMVRLADNKLQTTGLKRRLQQADVYRIPYACGVFDSVVNTMSFSGYPDGNKAIGELHRVLKPSGRLVMLDVNYPSDKNRIGMALTRMWISFGDIIRDMDALFERYEFTYQDEEVGGFGSVHLYIADKIK
jgi:ubiquinone/menaquinone biosynthesis C-methylase UbiE